MTRVRLSEKGLQLTAKIDELYQRNAGALADDVVQPGQLEEVNNVLNSLERYWSRLVNFTR
jgi:flagellin-specific chaperone FliS